MADPFTIAREPRDPAWDTGLAFIPTPNRMLSTGLGRTTPGSHSARERTEGLSNRGGAPASLRFLYATAETHPTHRADVRLLFGKWLPRLGINADLVATAPADAPHAPWGGGRQFVRRFRSRAGALIADLEQQFTLLCHAFRGYDGIIVRDKPLLAMIGLVAARLARIPFIYWMSFPMPEADLALARRTDGASRLGRRAFKWFRGTAGAFALYRVILPRADHLFVQSPVMLAEIRARHLADLPATAVPMGVDFDEIPPSLPAAIPRAKSGVSTAVYLGTLSTLRREELQLMVEAAREVQARHRNFRLIVIGEADADADKGWLERYATDVGAAEAIRFTGWLPYDEGLAIARGCALGVSPFPRGELFDSASPTKAIEYLALGLPVVCNDQPDQATVVQESGGGLCVALEVGSFASAISRLLDEPVRARDMGARGQAWVREHRSYARIAEMVASALRQTTASRPGAAAQSQTDAQRSKEGVHQR